MVSPEGERRTKMARIRQYMHRINGWIQGTSAIDANAADIPHLLEPKSRLQDTTTEVQALFLEQASLDARRGEVTRLLQQKLQEGDTLLDFLRTGVRQHYGYRSDKLIEFGIQPLRPGARRRRRLSLHRARRRQLPPPLLLTLRCNLAFRGACSSHAPLFPASPITRRPLPPYPLAGHR